MESLIQYITYIKEGNEENSRMALEHICSEPDNIYDDSELTQRYFEALHSHITRNEANDFEDMLIIYKALHVACRSAHGIFWLKQSQLCLELYCHLPTEFQIEDWSFLYIELVNLLFKILKIISKEYQFSAFSPLLYTVLERVTSAFLLQERNLELSTCALECLVNICSANAQMFGPEHVKALQIDGSLKTLLVRKFPETQSNMIDPFSTSVVPYLMLQLLFILEPFIGDVPDVKVLAMLQNITQALPLAISEQQDDIICRAVEFLTDIFSKPSKQTVLQKFQEFPKVLETILKSTKTKPHVFDEAHAAILTLAASMLQFISPDQLTDDPLKFGLQAISQFQNGLCTSDTNSGATCHAIAVPAIQLCKRSIEKEKSSSSFIFEKISSFGDILFRLCSHHARVGICITEVNNNDICCYLATLIRAVNFIYQMNEIGMLSEGPKTIVEDLMSISQSSQNSMVDLAFLQVMKTLKCHSQYEKETRSVLNVPHHDLTHRLALILRNGKVDEIFEVHELLGSLPQLRESVKKILEYSSVTNRKTCVMQPTFQLSLAHDQLLSASFAQLQNRVADDPRDQMSIIKLAHMKIESLRRNIEAQKLSMEAANKLNKDLMDSIAKQNQEYLMIMRQLLEKENLLQTMNAKFIKISKEVEDFEIEVQELKKSLMKEHKCSLQNARTIQLVRGELAEEKERFAALTVQYGQLTDQLKHRLEQSKGLEEKLAIFEKEASILQHSKKKLEKQLEAKDVQLKNMETEKNSLEEEIKQLHNIQAMVTQLMNRTQDKKKAA